MRRLREWWWVPLLYTLAVIWIYRGLWHQHGVATGLGWDTIDTHGPDLDFFARDIAEGRFSLWNPYDKGGYPVFCDPVFDRYYPFNWPFAAWGALFGTSWWLVQVKVLAHHVVAGIAMHAFLRSRGLSLRAAMIGGLGLIASAPLLTHKASNILWPLVWVPIVWMAVDFLLARPSWRRGGALAAAMLPVLTAGSPPGLFYALLMIGPYALFRLAGFDRTQWKQLAIALGVSAVIVGLVMAVTILPTQELVALGSRDRLGAGKPDFALALSLPLPAAARGLFVRGAGLFEMYLGAGLVMLALCALAVRPKFDRCAAILFASVAVVGLVLASGTSTPLLPLLVKHVPGFALLRVPGRYKLLCAWSVAAMAGYGVAAIEGAWAGAYRTRALACAGGAFVIAIACVAIWHMPASPKDRAAWWSLVAAGGAAVLVAATVIAPRRWAEYAVSALAIFVLFDAPAFTFVEPGAPPASDNRQTHARDEKILARLDGVREHYRIYDEFVLGERAGARLRVRDFRGYPAVDPISLHRYVDVLEYAKKDPAILTDFNVRYVLEHTHFRYGDSASFVAMPNRAFMNRGQDLWEAIHPAPLVSWVGAVQVVTNPAEVLPAVRASEDPDGVRRRAIVEEGVAAGGAPDERDGQLIDYEPDRIEVAVDAPRAGLVVLNEVMFPGWQVTVDGAVATPVRANYLLRAVWVEPGHHTIVWRFSPAHWRVLVGGYVLALAAIIAAAVAALLRRRRS